MSQARSLADRLMQHVRPVVRRDWSPPPVPIATDIWSLERRWRMPGGPVLSSRSTILHLKSQRLLVVSPPPVEPGGLAELDALGRVDEVLVPNSYHYLTAAPFLARYPHAALRVAPGLYERVAGLPRGEVLEQTAPSTWGADIEHLTLGPLRGVSEVVLFHRPSATLLLTDLAFNMRHFDSAWQRALWRLSGVPAGFGPSRTARQLLLSDRRVVAPFLTRVLTWPFERVLVAHGEALEVDAAATFRRAFAGYLD